MTEYPQQLLSKPFLKWAGGKQKLVPVLAGALGEGDRLVEPFVGSGAVFMGTAYKSYLLCDTNPDLIGLFKNLQKNPDAVLEETERLFRSEYNSEEQFYRLRELFNSLSSGDIRKSSLFVYLNKHAFNGLCRYNSKGGFNVPFGRYSSPKFPQKEMEAFSIKSQIADFICQGFEETFCQLRSGDLVYCDPPYVPLSVTASFTAYSKRGFGETEQIELAKKAREAADRGHRVVLSNHDVEFTREIYSSAELIKLDVHRSISSKSSTRGAAKELIAIFS